MAKATKAASGGAQRQPIPAKFRPNGCSDFAHPAYKLFDDENRLPGWPKPFFEAGAGNLQRLLRPGCPSSTSDARSTKTSLSFGQHRQK